MEWTKIKEDNANGLGLNLLLRVRVSHTDSTWEYDDYTVGGLRSSCIHTVFSTHFGNFYYKDGFFQRIDEEQGKIYTLTHFWEIIAPPKAKTQQNCTLTSKEEESF